MKNIKDIFMSNYKIKYMLMTVASVLTIGAMSFLVFSGIRQNKNSNSASNKAQIRNKFSRDDPKGKIDNIFVNTTPNKISTIYVGGSMLSDSNGIKGSLLESTDNGKTWNTDSYFTNPTAPTEKNMPEVTKVMTDYYKDEKGIADTIVVTGHFLKSAATTNNGNSSNSGEVAYERVFFGKTETTNTLKTLTWIDVADRDLSASGSAPTIQGYSAKVVAASTVTHISSGSKSVHDRIYIITSDLNVNVNTVKNIPYIEGNKEKTHNKGNYKFHAYEFLLDNKNVDETPYEYSLKTLDESLNPFSIYGTVTVTDTPANDKPNKTSTFDAKDTTFTFMSNITTKESTSISPAGDDKCYVVENQHFDASTDPSKTTIGNSNAFDYPLIISYQMSNPASKYLTVNANFPKDDFDNFIVKTIAINPKTPFNDLNYDSNYLIFAGEKNDKSYMISPTLDSSTLNPNTLAYPVMPTDSFTTNADTSYISKVISFPLFNVPIDSKNPDSTSTVVPLVIFGKNMSSSNANIAFPDSGTKFNPNTQKLTGQGLMLASIHFTSVKGSDNKTTISTSIYFSTTPQYTSSTQTTLVKYVDNSNNYILPGIASLNTGYNFYSSTYDITKTFTHGADLNDFKVIKSSDGKNNFNFANNVTKGKNSNKKVEIAVPVVVVLLIIILLPGLYFYNKIQKKKILAKANDGNLTNANQSNKPKKGGLVLFKVKAKEGKEKLFKFFKNRKG